MFEGILPFNAKLTFIEAPFCITIGKPVFLSVLPNNFRNSPENAYMSYRSLMVVNLTSIYLLLDHSFTPCRSLLAIIRPQDPFEEI